MANPPYESPVVSDAEYIGFDATAGVIAGGYTVQHSLGLDKQFTNCPVGGAW